MNSYSYDIAIAATECYLSYLLASQISQPDQPGATTALASLAEDYAHSRKPGIADRRTGPSKPTMGSATTDCLLEAWVKRTIIETDLEVPEYIAIRIVLTLFFTSLVGCANIQLQRNSVRQSGSVAKIYEQQVLDNLAEFVVNPYATPSFSIATQATNGVTTSGDVGLSDGAFINRFWGFVSASGSRDLEQNFTLDPVTTPGRLKLMQCAYQRAVGLPMDECDKCCEYLDAWTGKPNSCFDPCWVTSGWVCRSKFKSDVPKSCCFGYSKACGVYVWVDPCQRREFSKLVMAIIDYAEGDPAPSADEKTKDLVLYLANGKYAEKGKHTQEIRVSVPVGASQKEIEDLIKIKATQRELADKEALQKIAAEAQDLSGLMPQLLQAFPTLSQDAKVKQAITKDDLNPVELKEAVIGALKADIAGLKSSLEEPTRYIAPAAPSFTPMSFGPPTRLNNAFGGGILQEQQRLDTVPGRRR